MKPEQARRSALFLGVVFMGAGWPSGSDAQQSVKDDMNRGTVLLTAPSRPSKLLGIFWREAPPSSGFASAGAPTALVPSVDGIPVSQAPVGLLTSAIGAQIPAPLRGCGLISTVPNQGGVPGGGENPLFVEGRGLLANPRFQRLSLPVQAKYRGEWSGLHRWQDALYKQGVDIEARWKQVDEALSKLDTQACRYVQQRDPLEPRIRKWNATCQGKLDQGMLDWCEKEQARLDPEIKRRDAMGQELERAIARYNDVFYNPTKAQSDEWVAKVLSWEGKVQDFNRRLGEALNARKADIRFIDYLQKKYQLDDCQRRYLHDLITNQELSEEEIEEIAHDIGESGDHECPPGRGGRR